MLSAIVHRNTVYSKDNEYGKITFPLPDLEFCEPFWADFLGGKEF